MLTQAWSARGRACTAGLAGAASASALPCVTEASYSSLYQLAWVQPVMESEPTWHLSMRKVALA